MVRCFWDGPIGQEKDLFSSAVFDSIKSGGLDIKARFIRQFRENNPGAWRWRVRLIRHFKFKKGGGLNKAFVNH